MTGEFEFPPTPRTPEGVFLCGGCAPSGRCRLGLESVRLLGSRSARANLTCPPHCEGTSGVAHGSWTLGVIDEIMGSLTVLIGSPSVTTSLTVDFGAPVPLNEPLTLTGRLEAQDGRDLRLSAELVLHDDGPVLARGHGTLRRPHPTHFARQRDLLSRKPTD